jgi:hypothetical protein
MRKRARTDSNHAKLIKQCRQIGMTVHSTHNVHDGFPDIVAGYKGVNYLFEIKDPDKPKSARKLTDDEIAWHTTWGGSVNVIETIDDVLQIINKKV